MIDINHPDSQLIFQASRFTDDIRAYCRKYILEKFNKRQITFQDMQIEGLLLHEFSELHFKKNLKDISNLINDLNAEVEKLKTIDLKSENGNCTVCNIRLKTFDSLIGGNGIQYTICEKLSP
ncbi:hypothetical protein [Chryseobacterium taeanense]|uniref:hypothetical protein n=1 Tax=Chryseobacterium taeanense TaxID=311334 RepID=UPI0035B3B316